MKKRVLIRLLPIALFALLVVACTGATAQPSTTTVSLPAAPAVDLACAVEPIQVPTLPEEIPGYTEVDPATGLHMTGKPQVIDLESWRLDVTGMVDAPLSLSYDQLRCLPRVEAGPELVCPGFFVDQSSWAGTPIADVLALAGVQEGATGLRLESADGYASYVALEDLQELGGFLAYQWEGQPLPVLHGFPVRAVLPGQPGGLWVKWLVAIEVVSYGKSAPPPESGI